MNWAGYIAFFWNFIHIHFCTLAEKKMGHFPVDNHNKNSPSSNNKYIQILRQY